MILKILLNVEIVKFSYSGVDSKQIMVLSMHYLRFLSTGILLKNYMGLCINSTGHFADIFINFFTFCYDFELIRK